MPAAYNRVGIVFTRPARGNEAMGESEFAAEVLDELDADINMELMAIRLGAKPTYGRENNEKRAKRTFAQQAVAADTGLKGPRKSARNAAGSPTLEEDDEELNDLWTTQLRLVNSNTPRGGGLILHTPSQFPGTPGAKPLPKAQKSFPLPPKGRQEEKAAAAPRPKPARRDPGDQEPLVPLAGAVGRHFPSMGKLLIVAEHCDLQSNEGLQTLADEIKAETMDLQKAERKGLHDVFALSGSSHMATLLQL